MAKAESYTSPAKWLHWGMALIWIGAWFIGIVATHWRDEFNAHYELTFLHKALASTLLFLIVVRISWRITHPAPALPKTMSPLMKRGAFVGHFLLYGIALIGLPLSGWYLSSIADKPIVVAGLFLLPPLVDPDKSFYDLAKVVHTYISWLCGTLVGGHVLVALTHHFIEKDEVLKGMLPSRNNSV